MNETAIQEQVKPVEPIDLQFLPRRVQSIDYPELSNWYTAQNHRQPPIDWFSQLGFIVPGYAASFLYLSHNSKRGYIEDTCGNPNVDWKLRDIALDNVVAAVEEEAIRLGVKYLIGQVYNKRVLDRSVKHGYGRIETPFVLVVKDLTGKEFQQ